MLSYAFQVLKEQGVKDVDVESFDNVSKLCAEILIKGVSRQLKRGLAKEYVNASEELPGIKGKIEITETMKEGSYLSKKLVCSYDEYTEDFKMNQILKSTMQLLLHADIFAEQKRRLKNLLMYFNNVEETDLMRVDWNIQYNRNNLSYQLLITICYFVVKGLLQTTTDGSTKLMDFLDDQRMSRLYEKFLLEYYRYHYPKLLPNASMIQWQLDQEGDSNLPVMKSDIMLHKENDYMIIDAKYYSNTTQVNYDKHTIHSGNLYQLFTYVKNKEYELTNTEHKPVVGLLLYAKTDEDIQPDGKYLMSGNEISVKTLDLNKSFKEIEKQLQSIVSNTFDYNA